MHKTKEEKAVFTVTDLCTNWIVAEGDMYTIREHLETMFEERAGFFISLQEYVDTDDNTFSVALHSDSYEDCTDEQIIHLHELGIDEDEEQTTIVLLYYVGAFVSFSHYID